MNSKIAIVGSGRVAEALIIAMLNKKNSENVTIIARNEEKVVYLSQKYRIKYNTTFTTTETFDYIIIAVKDESITEVSELVSQFSKDAIVCHTSGSVHIDAISSKNINVGVFYPLQSFTDGVKINFSEIPIFLEAKNDTNLALLKELAIKISNNVSTATSETREKLHLCGVFINNFTNHLFAITDDIVKDEGINIDALLPLTKATFERILTDVPHDIQTGPARRGDITTINRHAEILKNRPSAKKLYETFSDSILTRYKDEF